MRATEDAVRPAARFRAWLLAAAIGCLLAAAVPAQEPQVIESSELSEAELEFDASGVPLTPPEPGPARRKTITPWIVDVYGKNYEDFTNEGASRVISDWLTNALIDLDLFNIVNRERIRAVISERNLALSGMARDISSNVPENELATAGKLLSVNYILLGNVKNLGANSEIDFKLLDVESATYSTAFRLNFQIPFNPLIEKFKPVVDRIVAALAGSFPIVARIVEIVAPERLIVQAGSASGLVEGLTAELWHFAASAPAATGVIADVGPMTSVMVLDQPFAGATLWEYEARIAVAPGPEAVISAGDLEMKRGNFAKARDLYAQGLEAHPGHGRILALHARSSWRLHDYEGAVGSYREALKAEPNDLRLLEEAVQVLFEAGRFQEVVELLREPARATRNLDLELHLGTALAIQGYPRQAREAYKRAFRLEPDNPRPHLRLAVLAARSGERSEVQRELRLALEAGPGALEIELANAIFGGLSSEPPGIEAAEPWIERAQADGDFVALAIASELLLLQPRLWQEALTLAHRSVELNSAFLQGQILISEANVLGGQLEQALAVLDDALEAHPNSVALLVRSGELLSALGDYEKGELRLRQAMDLAPLQWRPADALGDSYFRRSAYLKAVDAYQTAWQIAEESEAPELNTRLEKLGRAAVLANQHATAQPYLERCVAGTPDNKECRYYLGLCYFVSNLPHSDEQAIVNLKAAGEAYPDGNYYLGALYDRREDFETARDWYQLCVDAGCSLADKSQRRVDDIEAIRGTVIGRARRVKEVNLDVGRIHGVQPSQLAIVLSQGEVVGRVRTEQVQEKTSVAKILGGEPLPGHSVVFRPTRPRGLTARPAEKRGVTLKWNLNRDPDLAKYIVYRREKGEVTWQVKKVVGREQNLFLDRSAKPGKTYFYQLTARSSHNLESLASRVCEITLD